MKQRWFMHSMFNISLPVADAIFTWANVILVVGAVLALLGTVGVFWSGGVRERYADERIAANEAETARAKAETAQARLEQERLKAQMAWRRVTPEQAGRLAAALAGKRVQLWLTYVGDDPESATFREDLNQALTAAGVAHEVLQRLCPGSWTRPKGRLAGAAGDRRGIISRSRFAPD